MATTSKCNANSLLGRQQQSFTIPPYHHPTAGTAAASQQQQQQEQHSFTNNSFLSSNNNNNNNHDYFNHSQFSGVTDHEMMMMKCRPTTEKSLMVDMEITEKNNNNNNNQMVMMADRKRRLRSDQIDWLERSFQEDIKLEPERKMKLSQDLSLHPRQVAIWFQNRRARWKTKQLERLYDSLKLEFDIICREKQNLQEEVMKLRAKLEELETVKQVSTGYTEASTADETVESTSVVKRSSNIQETTGYSQMIAGCSYISSVHNYNSASPPCWGVLPPGYP